MNGPVDLRRCSALVRPALLGAAVAALVASLASAAWATITPLGRYTFGSCYNGCALGDTVYWGSGPMLRIADLSQPGQPRDIGRVPLAHTVLGVYAVPGRAYVACQDVGLVIVDTSDPATPRVVGTLWRFRPVRGMAEVGGCLLMSNASDGLSILNVSDPAHVRSVGHWYTPTGSAHDMVVEGSLVYLSCGRSGLQILDFSNPAAPVLVGQVAGFVPGFGIAKAGNFVYLTVLPTGLTVIDVTDPANPIPRGYCPNITDGDYLTARHGSVFVACAEGVQAVDVTNPDQPVPVGTFPHRSVNSVFFDDRALYAAASGYGLLVLDPSQPAALREIGEIDDNGYSLGITAGDGFVYLTAWYDGLRILDARDPTAPRLAATVPAYAAYTPVLRDGILYVAAADLGALVIDVHDPYHPVTLAAMPGWWVRGITLDGKYAYVADDSYGLSIYDVSDPAAPSLVGSLIMSGEVDDVAVCDGWAYVASGNQGMRVVDVRDPAVPLLHGTFTTAGYCLRVVVEGRIALIAESTSGVEICDLSDPEHPVRRSGIQESGIQVRDAELRQGRLYLTDELFGLVVYDLSDPSNPRVLDASDQMRGAQRVAFDGKQVWVSVMEDGAYALRDNALTPVMLAGFRARRAADGVRLDWTLGAQQELSGIEVHRQRPGGARERLTGAPLAPDAAGSYVDPSPSVGTVTYWLRGVDRQGGASWLGSAEVTAGAVPERLTLAPAGPNPFNPRVTLRLALPRAARVGLAIYDSRGRRVRDLLNAELPAGEHAVSWNGMTEAGRPAASGTYVARLVTELGVRSVKLTLAR